MTYSTSRVQHVHLETHGSIAWQGDDGRLHVRTSSQAPFIVQQKLCHLFGLYPRNVHVFTERVGGGFGGKQEMISEDLCVLATLKTGRPVKWEFTREEQFIGATTRHQMTTRVKLGAKRDGTLTAIEVHVVSNTGAYGGHAGETLAAALGSPLTAYRCANKKADGYAVYTNMVPGGGFRGYGASQTTFAIECAIDDLARLHRHGSVRDPPQEHGAPERLDRIGLEGPVRCGVRQLRSRPVPRPGRAGAGGRTAAPPKPAGADWAEGTGIALAMLDCGPPTEHRVRRRDELLPDGRYHLAVGSTEMGNGSVTSHRQIAASLLGARADQIDIINADTDLHALRHRHLRQHRHRGGGQGRGAHRRGAARQHPRLRRAATPAPSRRTGGWRRQRRSAATSALRSPICMRRAPRPAIASRPSARPICRRARSPSTSRACGSRSIASTGEIRILHSVHAADIGRLINPMQCRGQIDGAIAMGFGWALTENMVLRRHGHDGQPDAAQLSHPGLRRRAAQRSVVRRHLRHDRPARRQVAGRMRDQSGRAGDRPTRSPTRPACASRICRSRRTASSPSCRCQHDAPRATGSSSQARGTDDRHADAGATRRRGRLRAMAGRDQRGDRPRFPASSSRR